MVVTLLARRFVPMLLMAAVLASVPVDAGDATGDQPVPGVWVIPAGETLVVQPGTHFHGRGPIVIEGSMDIRGTAAEPALFEVPVLVRGGAVSGSHARFSPALGTAIDVQDGSLTLSNVVFDGGAAAVTAELGVVSVVIERATFTGYPDTAIRLSAPGDFRVSSSSFSGNGESVRITLYEAEAPGALSSSYSFTDNAFMADGGHLIAVRAVDVTPHGVRRIDLTGNTFLGSPGFTADNANAAVFIVARDPQADGAAVTGLQPLIRSSDNLFKGNAIALHLEKAGYDFVSTRDTFLDNDVGVLLRSVDGPRFVETVFSNLRWDIQSDALDTNVILSGVSYSNDRVFFGARDTVAVDGVALPYVAAGAAAIGVAGLLAVLFTDVGWGAFQRFLVAPLYTRLSRDDIIGNEKRQNIIQYVSDTPGAHLRRIATELEMSYGTLTYHVYRLEKEGFITSRAQGAFKRFFPATGGVKRQSSDRPLETELRGVEREIYDYMGANPGTTQSDIAKALGLSRQALHYHVKKLDKRGFLRKVTQGRETLCYVRTGNEPDGDGGAAAAAQA